MTKMSLSIQMRQVVYSFLETTRQIRKMGMLSKDDWGFATKYNPFTYE